MNYVDFQKLFAEAPETFRDVEVKKLGGTVRVNKLTALQLLPIITSRDAYNKKDDGTLVNDEDAAQFALDCVCASVTDGDGNLQFKSEKGREWLRSSLALWLLFPHVSEINGLTEDLAKKKRE